jgi:TonB family protein
MSRVLVATIAFIAGSGLALLILFGFLDFMKAGVHRGLNLIDAHHPDSIQNESKRPIAPKPLDIFPQDPSATPRATTLPLEQEPEKPLSQSKGNLLARPSPLARSDKANPVQTESSPISPSIQAAAGVPVGYVASNSHFLSLRTPAASREDAPQENGAVHIGQLIYSPQAIYPEQALRLHEEGVVKVLVIVGLDGSVMRVASASGPPALVPCALRVVRDWRYSSTLIGEKPVETEQEITFVFRQ